MPSQPLTPEQRQRRAKAIAQAYGSLRIEGIEPTAEGKRQHQRWVNGQASADEIVAELTAYHLAESA